MGEHDGKQKAVGLLVQYMGLFFDKTGLDWTGDNSYEMEALVEAISEATLEKLAIRSEVKEPFVNASREASLFEVSWLWLDMEAGFTSYYALPEDTPIAKAATCIAALEKHPELVMTGIRELGNVVTVQVTEP